MFNTYVDTERGGQLRNLDMAEKITVNVPHKLGVQGARDRIDSGFAKVQEQIAGKSVEVSQEWSGNEMSFTAGAMGQNLSGKLYVLEETVRIEVTLPWILAKLSGTVQEKLQKQTQVLLEKK